MIDSIWQDMEQDASRKLSAAASARAGRVRLWKARHALFVTMGILAFCALVVGQLAPIRGERYVSPWLLGLAVAATLILTSGFASHSRGALLRVGSVWNWLNRYYQRVVFADYLSPYFLVAVFLIALPSLLLLAVIWYPHLSTRTHDLAIPTSRYMEDPLRGLLTSLMGVAVAIIAAQVALFNFLFGQLLGKYASGVVQTVIHHRAVRAARYGAFLFLGLIMSALAGGVPAEYVSPFPYFQIFAVAIAFFCFSVSIGIANAGVHAVHAIDLAGMQFAKEVRAAVPASIDPNSSPWVWRTLNVLGLDWRDSRRFAAIGEPKGGIDVTIGALQMLFGIGAKAIQDGQHDILLASCRAILRIANAYRERRIAYIAMDDHVFAYMNDQCAALMKTAAKSVNEYLITDVVRLMGGLGQMSVSIGKLPAGDGDTGKVNQSLQSHFLSAVWMGLLKETVVATYNLELPRFRGQFLVFTIFVLCIDLTRRSLTARKRGQKLRGDFLIEFAKNRPRVKLQERRSRVAPGVGIPANRLLRHFSAPVHAARAIA